MKTPEVDNRSHSRKARDEQIAAEPQMAPLDLPPNASSSPLETHLAPRRRPVAVAGVVENGVVRPIDPAVTLPEHSRVIIVATERTEDRRRACVGGMSPQRDQDATACGGKWLYANGRRGLKRSFGDYVGRRTNPFWRTSHER